MLSIFELHLWQNDVSKIEKHNNRDKYVGMKLILKNLALLM